MRMRGIPRFKDDKERRLGKAQSSRDWHRVTRHESWFEKHEYPARESTKAPPTLAELRVAFLHRNDSCENMIRLGSMLEDIEARYCVGYEFSSSVVGRETYMYVDTDAPWQTGIRGYIKTDPFLLSKYNQAPDLAQLLRSGRWVQGRMAEDSRIMRDSGIFFSPPICHMNSDTFNCFYFLKLLPVFTYKFCVQYP